MSEYHKQLLERYIEMWNTGNLALANEILAPTYRDHAHPEVTSIVHVQQALQKTRASIPDFQITVEQIISEGAFVSLRATIRRTIQGQTRFSRVIWFARVVDGFIAELWTGSEASS